MCLLIYVCTIFIYVFTVHMYKSTIDDKMQLETFIDWLVCIEYMFVHKSMIVSQMDVG